MSIKVMLADDHILVREGIKYLIELDEEIEVVCEVSDGEDCIRKIPIVNPNVLLLDIHMPIMNGIEVLRDLKKRKIDVKVIILTIHDEIEYITKAIENGTNGYLLKDIESKELKKAIKLVSDGKQYIQQKLLSKFNSKLDLIERDKNIISQLTSRELEVLKQVANGMFNKEIATNLNISERTVKNHISNIFKKIDVADRTQAALFAIKSHIINL